MPFMNKHNVIENDAWKIINTNDLPEGIQTIAMPSIELIELLRKSDNANVIVPLHDKIQTEGLTAEAMKLIEKDNKIGIWVNSQATTEQLDQLLEQADDIELILIDVSDFNNGRAFSLSQHLRMQGYHGEIRLTGKFGVDQLAYYQRSGIDNFGFSDDRKNEQQANIHNTFHHLATAPTGRTADELPMFRDGL